MASMFPAPVSPPAPQAAPCGLLTYAALTTATIGWAECLGSGSYGAVYAGVLNGERVAVKRFRQKDSGTDSFLREVAVAALVQHPHVLRVVAMVRARPTRYACLARQAPRRGAQHAPEAREQRAAPPAELASTRPVSAALPAPRWASAGVPSPGSRASCSPDLQPGRPRGAGRATSRHAGGGVDGAPSGCWAAAPAAHRLWRAQLAGPLCPV